MRTTLASATVAGLLVLLASCSGSSDDAAKTTTTKAGPKTVSVDQWAKGFCADASAWLDDLEEANSSIGADLAPDDYAGVQDAVVDHLGSAAAATTELVESTQNGPVPDMDDGAAFVEDLAAQFESIAEAFELVQTDAKAMGLDPATFQDDLTALSDRFTGEIDDVGSSITAIGEKYPDPALEPALEASCTF